MPANTPRRTDTDAGNWRGNSGCIGGGKLSAFGFGLGFAGRAAEPGAMLGAPLAADAPCGVIWGLLHQLAELGFGFVEQQQPGFGFACIKVALAKVGCCYGQIKFELLQSRQLEFNLTIRRRQNGELSDQATTSTSMALCGSRQGIENMALS